MTSIGFNRFCRSLVLLAALLEFSVAARAESLSSIFTNIAPTDRRAIPRRASIIFIQCDGLGYGDLSCYGQTKFQTPNLDKLAAEGIRFTNYHAGAVASSPARAALLLGKDSEHLKQRADVDLPLAADEITVAQILKNSGYHTGLVGEWNLGDENSSGAPWLKGFDEFAGYFDPADAENFYADYIWSLPSSFSYDKASGTFIEWNPAQGRPVGGREMLYANTKGKNQYIPDLLTKVAMNFIKNNQPDRSNHYRPFFLLLNYPVPHAGKTLQVPTDAPFSDEPWPQPEKNKAAIISRLDGYIGELQEQLQKLGLTNNVAIFFTSDTVPKKSAEIDPDFFHSNIAANDLRVPMIVHWPENISAGRVSKLRWSVQDFAPTALQIAYAKPAASFTGISILPVLLGEPGTNTPALLDRQNY
jgi:arylsulfatase A-like enzyme